MKFCYLDETGTGEGPIAVMAGVITDAVRMHVTKSHWAELLKVLSKIVGRDIQEIHTREFYSGNSPWRDLNGNQRSDTVSAIFDWLKERKHQVVFTAVDKELFQKQFHEEPFAESIGTLWRHMALHITLSLQKHLQRERKNKGNFVLVFDSEEREKNRFTDLVLTPPAWTDTYYAYDKKRERLDQVIDVPHFVDSRDVGLIQLADFICFFLRKHIELQLGLARPAYQDEIDKVKKWASQIFEQAIPKSCVFLSKGRCEPAARLCKYAPKCIL